MTLEIWLLISSGVVALLAGVLVLVGSAQRLASLLAGVSLGLLGLLQLGLARAVYATRWGGRNTWFELCLVFALMVSVTWVLLSATLARTSGLSRLRGWRLYVFVQTLLCAVATVVMLVTPLSAEGPAGSPGPIVPLRPAGLAVVALLVANVILLTANFESTYLALPRQARHRLAPAVAGVVLGAAYYAYVLGFSLMHGHISLSDLGGSGVPVAALSVLLSIAMIRGRVGEITLPEPGRPVYRTTSLVVAALTFGAVLGVLQLTEATGWSLARATWTVMIGVGVASMGALLVSNRIQRRLWGVLQPYLQRSRLRRTDLWTRLHRRIDAAHAPEDLHQIVPSAVREITGLAPVTLFVREREGRDFVPVASTLKPAPAIRLRDADPLVREFRRSRHPLFLAGRSDDLEYIPIYVENGTQLRACQATCAAPLEVEGDLLGFLLCGHPENPEESAFERLPLLEFLSLGIAERLGLLTLRAQVAGSRAEGAALDTPDARS